MTQQPSSASIAPLENPLLAPEWTSPFGVPPFGEIVPAQFRPAFEQAFAAHSAEVAAIAADPAEPTFANTIAAMELSGETLSRVASVFYLLTGANTNDAIQAIEREIAPLIGAALGQHLSQRRAVPPDRGAARPARPHRPDAGAAARAGALLRQLQARRRRTRCRRQGAAGRDQRTARDARHDIQPERARRRAELHAGA